MRQNEGAVLLFGTVCLFGLYKIAKATYTGYKDSLEELQKLEQIHEQMKTHKIDFQKLKAEKKEKDILIGEINPKSVTPETINIRIREFPIDATEFLLSNDVIYRNITGGEFQFTHQKRNFVCDIRDTHVSTSILNAVKKPVSIFDKTEPIATKIDLLLKSNSLIAIYGSVSYDENLKKWVIEPYFLGQNITQIINYWFGQKLLYQILGVLLSCATAFVIGVFGIKPIISWVKKNQEKFKEINKGELQHFKSMKFFEAPVEENLNCLKCKQKIAEIIYECGHLGICRDCWDISKERRELNCTVCGKNSKKFLKLYMI